MHLRDPFRIDDHEIQITGRVVRIVSRGTFTADHARRYAELVDAALPRGVAYAVIADVSKLHSISPEARRSLASWRKGSNCRQCVIIGSPLLLRGLITLLIRALGLIGGRVIDLRFCSDEATAEALIAEWQKPHADPR